MTAAAVLNLKRAGFTDEQVTVLADLFNSRLATRADVALLLKELRVVKWLVGLLLVVALAIAWDVFTLSTELDRVDQRLARLERLIQAPGAP